MSTLPTCDEDGDPYDAERLADWLDKKYSRHGEEEDRQAAAMLRRLTSTQAEPVAYVKPEQLETLRRDGVAMLDASVRARGFCTAPIFITAPSQAPEGAEAVIGYATHHDEPMLFPTIEEARQFCDDDEEPIPLVALSTQKEPGK